MKKIPTESSKIMEEITILKEELKKQEKRFFLSLSPYKNLLEYYKNNKRIKTHADRALFLSTLIKHLFITNEKSPYIQLRMNNHFCCNIKEFKIYPNKKAIWNTKITIGSESFNDFCISANNENNYQITIEWHLNIVSLSEGDIFGKKSKGVTLVSEEYDDRDSHLISQEDPSELKMLAMKRRGDIIKIINELFRYYSKKMK